MKINDQFFNVFDKADWYLAGQLITEFSAEPVKSDNGDETPNVWATELLIRLFEGDRFLSNGKFFPEICLDDRYPRITQQIIRLVKSHMEHDARVFPKRTFINITPTDLEIPETIGLIRELIESASQYDKIISLEFSEIFTFGQLERNLATSELLQSEGALLGLDDFGTGVLTPENVSNFPFDFVKADRSLCCSVEATQNPLHLELVKVAKAKGIMLIAEGIEETDVIGPLRALGYDYGQGYLFQMPAKLLEHMNGGTQ